MFDIIEPGGFATPEGRYVCVDTIGMDYESAAEATPRWYGVSFGNGNDGVSHMWPNFYVKTCEPYVLAVAAILADFKAGEEIAWAVENLYVDGEPEYGISATLLDPPNDREDYEAGLDLVHDALAQAETEEEKEELENRLEELESEDPGSWSEANGAWMICEVFQVDAPASAPAYDSLRETFSADLIEIAREV